MNLQVRHKMNKWKGDLRKKCQGVAAKILADISQAYVNTAKQK